MLEPGNLVSPERPNFAENGQRAKLHPEPPESPTGRFRTKEALGERKSILGPLRGLYGPLRGSTDPLSRGLGLGESKSQLLSVSQGI